MKTSNPLALVLSLIALGLAVFALIPKANKAETTNPETYHKLSVIDRSSLESPVVSVQSDRNWLGGNNTIEMRRSNRIDLFNNNLNNGIFIPPRDFFDLSPRDKEAADKLSAALTTPDLLLPFRPFGTDWEVVGPSDALARVESYQLNVFSSGPIFNLPVESTTLTSQGLREAGSVTTSMWQSGKIALWAHFGSGIRELTTKEVEINTSHCDEAEKNLDLMVVILQGIAGSQFVDSVRARAGEDVTVTVTEDPTASVSNNGFRFQIGLRLDASNGTLDVQLDMQFGIVPHNGNLMANFTGPGYRNIAIDPDLPFLDDVWHTLTLGEHNLDEYYSRFMSGLEELANGFASAIGRDMRGLPAEIGDEQQEEDAPKIVSAEINLETNKFTATVCPISGLVLISGMFPAKMLQVNPN